MCLHFRLSVMRLPGQSTSHVVGTYVRKALKCNDDRDCSVAWCWPWPSLSSIVYLCDLDLYFPLHVI